MMYFVSDIEIFLSLKDLEDFIKKGKDGFILFSMGTAIKGNIHTRHCIKN